MSIYDEDGEHLMAKSTTKSQNVIDLWLKEKLTQQSTTQRTEQLLGQINAEKTDTDFSILDILLLDLEKIDQAIETLPDAAVMILIIKLNQLLEHAITRLNNDAVEPTQTKNLVEKINLLLTKSHAKQPSEVLKVDKVIMNVTNHQVVIAQQTVNLTLNEFNLLKAFLSFPNKVFSREELLNITHRKYHESYERTIDSHIKNLRKKLHQAHPPFAAIESVYGVGYRYLSH